MPLTYVSCLEIVIKLVNVHVETVDEVHFVEDVVPHDSVAQSDIVLHLHQAVVHGVAVESSDALVQVQDVALLLADHRSEEQTSLLVNLALINANSVDWNLSQHLHDLSHRVDAIPGDEQQALAGTDDELIFLAHDRNAERNDFLSEDLEHEDFILVVKVHLEDLPAENIAPEQHVGVLAVEDVLSSQVHHTLVDLLNLVVRHCQ